MLKKNTYCILDFETTWLDIQHDEPIQVGIVIFDENFTIQDTYTSYIRPTDKKADLPLKNIVTYLTNIQQEQIEHAPTMEEILPHMQQKLDKVDVIIGHNIQFDMLMLQKYTHIDKVCIDTFPLSKTLMHFLPSYALSILTQHISLDHIPTEIKWKWAHDALYDCYLNFALFRHLIERITTLVHEYPPLKTHIDKTEWMFFDILHTSDVKNSQQWNIDTWHVDRLPVLQKPIPTERKVYYANKAEQLTLPTGKVDVSTYTLSDLLQRILPQKKTVIYSFSHKPKATLAQQILHSWWVKTTTLHDVFVFNPEMTKKFLQQPRLQEEEGLFLLAYYSSHKERHMMMDVNTASTYKIFHALTDIKQLNQKTPMITTHDQLATFAHKITPDSHIYFFDHPRRFAYAKKHLAKEVDLIHLLTHVEQLAYKYNLAQQEKVHHLLQYLQDKITLFIGVLHIEIRPLRIGYGSHQLEIDTLKDHPRLPKTRAMIQQIHDLVQQTKKLITPAEQQKIEAIRTAFYQQASSITLCYQHLHQSWWYMTFRPETSYVSYEDAQEILPTATYTYLHHTPQAWYHPLWSANKTHQAQEIQKSTYPTYQTATTTNACLQKIQKTLAKSKERKTYIFVLSTSKKASQDLFAHLVETKKHQERCVIGENITSGRWAGIYKAEQHSWPVVMIGWFQYFLIAAAKWIAFHHIFVYHIHGELKKLILKDMYYYTHHLHNNPLSNTTT